ncbi:hypothetical protein FA95DRAFT_1292979 [Auriscalpium vulgare]|uniref:Uncharacterized protein n=1 Tax=Auriscalpium vulgare TaxID=40419 RepID=A0ACB8RT29_9AGAM|nr:hypothetical protein FA95DRAFT_1292979 [Auriscalpium vulgare]
MPSSSLALGVQNHHLPSPTSLCSPAFRPPNTCAVRLACLCTSRCAVVRERLSRDRRTIFALTSRVVALHVDWRDSIGEGGCRICEDGVRIPKMRQYSREINTHRAVQPRPKHERDLPIDYSRQSLGAGSFRLETPEMTDDAWIYSQQGTEIFSLWSPQ